MAATMKKTVLMTCFVYLGVITYLGFVQGKYKLSEIELPKDGKFRVFTDEDIAAYDGSKPDQPIYMAVRGVVFDVSEGKSFYGKDASYNALVGKDCSRAVAKMSLEPEDLNNKIDDLGDQLLESLDKTFLGTYMEKYPVVGYMEYFVTQKSEATKDEF